MMRWVMLRSTSSNLPEENLGLACRNSTSTSCFLNPQYGDALVKDAYYGRGCDGDCRYCARCEKCLVSGPVWCNAQIDAGAQRIRFDTFQRIIYT